VVERRNMINDYLRGRACIESVRGSWFQGECWFWAFVLILSFCLGLSFSCSSWAFPSSSLLFCLALPLFMPFAGFCDFHSSRWPSWAFLGFLGLLAVLNGVLDLNFKLCAFVVDGLIKGEIEKPSGPFLGLIVTSHWLGEVWIRIRDSFILFFFYLCFVGESRLLVSWCAGGRCVMTCSDEDRGRSRRPGAEDQGWLHWSDTRWSGGREVGWRHVRSAPDTWRLWAWVSWLSLKTKVDSLWVVWPQNYSDGF
jgi:hypothetical protein